MTQLKYYDIGSNTWVTAVVGAQGAQGAQGASGSGSLVFSVKDYGATGNGTTDDTAAIQSCINAAVAVKGTVYFPPGTYNVQQTSSNAAYHGALSLGGPCEIFIAEGAKVRMTNTGLFSQMFFAPYGTDMSGLWIHGGGIIDLNASNRSAGAGTPATGGAACRAIGDINVGSGLRVSDLRFTNQDNIWCITLGQTAGPTLSNLIVENCVFDTMGTTDASKAHDNSVIYMDAIGMTVRNNVFWVGAPGSTSFATNYGARTAVELHGSDQNCHHNTTYGMPWGGNLVASPVSYGPETSIKFALTGATTSAGVTTFTTSATHNLLPGMSVSTFGITESGSGVSLVGTWIISSVTSNTVVATTNATTTYVSGGNVAKQFMTTGCNWHDNHFYNCKIGIEMWPIPQGALYPACGLENVQIHDNVITVDSTLWNVDIGGTDLGGITGIASVLGSGDLNRISITNNTIQLVQTNMSSFSYTGSPPSWIMFYSSVINHTCSDWIVSGNNLVGSLGDGIHLYFTNSQGITVDNNMVRDCGLAQSYATRFGVYVVSTGTGYSCRITNNQMVDDQSAVQKNTPYGYSTSTTTGPIFFNSGLGNNNRILDNSYVCSDTSLFTPFASAYPGGTAPYLRGTMYNTYYNNTLQLPGVTAPTLAGSEITIITQRNSTSQPFVKYVQSASPSGSTWVPVPIFSSTGSLQISQASSGVAVAETATGTITNVTTSGGYVTYICNNNFKVQQIVSITGITPSAFNLSNQVIVSLNSTSFTVQNAATGTYSSGGTATVNPNPKQGTATLSAGTVTVSNTSVTATSRIFLTVQSLGTVAVPQALAVTARTPGTSFTITSASITDTSVVAYEIFEVG